MKASFFFIPILKRRIELLNEFISDKLLAMRILIAVSPAAYRTYHEMHSQIQCKVALQNEEKKVKGPLHLE